MRSWLLIFIGTVFALLAATNLWTTAQTTFRSVPATAKVIRTEGGIGRVKSVHAQVEVSLPGQKAFRTEVEDSLGLGTWTEGGTIDLVCTTLSTGSPHCELDSALDRWLLSLLFFAVGCTAIWWAIRRRNYADAPKPTGSP